MQKIGDVTNTADGNGEYTNGNVAAGVAPTILDAVWFNTIQREIINVISKAGIKLNKNNDAQLSEAIFQLISNGKIVLTDNLGNSSGLAVSQKLTNQVNDNANTRLEKSKNGADIPDPKRFVLNLGLAETKKQAENAAPRDWVSEHYADKFSNDRQVFASSVAVSGGLIVEYKQHNAGIYIDAAGRRYIGSGRPNHWAEIDLPIKSGQMALADDSYTKTESDRKYQRAGNYATNAALNAIKTESGAGWIRDPTTGVVTQWGTFRTHDGTDSVIFPRSLIAEIYFIGITVAGSSSNQVGYANETLTGMRITRGAGDAQDRAGRWLVIGV
ncbi:hypothetical protein KKJ13_17490 [Xenorhabdus bovienii]|nr:hypothetical protein [Xenorhabdus bovienii]MDE9443335.1 hypothetical protein [Xenorhabdus bovienii]